MAAELTFSEALEGEHPDGIPAADPARFFRLVATADWQIGMRGGALPPGAAQTLRSARTEGIERILRLAEAVRAQAVLAAGDLFEFPCQPKATRNAVAAILHRHTGVPVHAIPGNHDLYGPGTVWCSPELEAVKHLHLHHEDGRVELARGVFLWPLPVRSKHDLRPQHERLPEVTAEAGIHVVMAHGHDTAYLDLSGDLEHEDCTLPLDSRAIIDKGYAALLLGHWHSWLQVGPRVLYPGTHEQTRFGDRDPGHVAVVDLPLDGGEPGFHKVAVGGLRWRRESLDISGLALPDAVIERARELSAEVDFLELSIVGDIDLDDRLDDLPRAVAAIEPMPFAYVNCTDRTRERIDLATATERHVLPLGLAEVQADLLAEIARVGQLGRVVPSGPGSEGAQQDPAGLLRAELQALYEVARDVGALRSEPCSEPCSGPTSEGPTSEGSTSEGSTSEGPTSEGPTSEGPTSEGPRPEELASEEPA